jgi:putative ABC transport system permease protein
MSALLYGVTPGDPVSFLVAPGVLIVVAGAAGTLATRRAARIDPIVAFRAE